eukprot:3928644-Amphidinium_carterae.1
MATPENGPDHPLSHAVQLIHNMQDEFGDPWLILPANLLRLGRGDVFHRLFECRLHALENSRFAKHDDQRAFKGCDLSDFTYGGHMY